MKTCANCGKKILLGGTTEQDLPFCSSKCVTDFNFQKSDFCQKCRDETTDDGPGRMHTVNGIGTCWGWKKTDKCPECGSEVMTKYTSIVVPVFPKDKYRVLQASRRVGLAAHSQQFKARRLKAQPGVVSGQQMKTLSDFAKAWVIFWIVVNIAAVLAPISILSQSAAAGLIALAMLLSAVAAAGYWLLYNKKHIGLYVILGANLLGVFLNFVYSSSSAIKVTTGLIPGIITYFVTRGQVAYPFGKAAATELE